MDSDYLDKNRKFKNECILSKSVLYCRHVGRRDDILSFPFFEFMHGDNYH
jgi:hypothetical protein